MKPRFNPFPKRSGRFGAPMGRVNTRTDFSGLHLDDLCVSRPQGEYDSGGAYWGIGGADGPVFAVWERGNGIDGVVYVRANGTDGARYKALNYHILSRTPGVSL